MFKIIDFDNDGFLGENDIKLFLNVLTQGEFKKIN